MSAAAANWFFSATGFCEAKLWISKVNVRQFIKHVLTLSWTYNPILHQKFCKTAQIRMLWLAYLERRATTRTFFGQTQLINKVLLCISICKRQ